MVATDYQTTSPGRVWRGQLAANRLRYPSEPVVRWLARIRPSLPADAAAIEMGFGSGRHLQLLLDQGLQAWGTELLEDAIALGDEILGAGSRAGRVVLGPLDHPDLPRSAFDVFLTWGTLFLMPPDAMKRTLGDAARLLKPGGHALFNLRTPDNWFAGLGAEGPAGHWLLDDRAGPYAGSAYTFLDHDAIAPLLDGTGLRVHGVERMDWWQGPQMQRHSWWIVHAIRD
ncbi:class I SAM-dependent methyltransferase [Rubrivivax sp. JA1024]|uniref:class I SAM-dependent methyltransferase n=1 Tax=Rubrivivax sp. JA1026 TaxID=2710888 RepID=UPI0013E992F9|nr:class I SAM-dependent methyltransferase [Rubrivivax sp. JA1026]MCD0418125.1 class I SAM-dependent methyltransferase [Rubrivivax sp. JA1024]